MSELRENSETVSKNAEHSSAGEFSAREGRPAFRGNFEHSIDEKGRVSVPSPFRQILTELQAQCLVLTNFVSDGARCLDAYTKAEWEAFETRLSQRGKFDPQVRKLEHYYLARAVECPLDSSGRINIPQHLRNYAGIEREVVFTASLSGFRLWDKRVWELVFREAEAALLENPALFADVERT